jgi:6-pyruvoyl-tetrahydropterin synthase
MECIKSVFEKYENSLLNELHPFNIFQPTAENMAMYFYNRLEDALSELNLGLDSISQRYPWILFIVLLTGRLFTGESALFLPYPLLS